MNPLKIENSKKKIGNGREQKDLKQAVGEKMKLKKRDMNSVRKNEWAK